MYKQATQLTLSIATLIILCTLAACNPHVPRKTDADNDQNTITFAVYSLDLGHYKALAQTFNAAHPTIQVQIQGVDALFSPQDDLSPGDELCLLASSADAFLYYEMDPITLSASGAVYDLQPLLERHPEFASDDFFSGLLARFAEHEGLWGIPAGVEPLLVYYNRSLFDAAGVDYPQPGWTWDDFLDTALALTNLDTGVWGFVEQYRYGSAGAFIYQHGGTLVDKGGPDFSDPLAVEVLNWYTDLARTHHVMPGPNSSDAPRPEGNKLPQIGHAAMWIGIPDQTHNTNTGVVSLPRDQRDAAMANVPAYYVSAGTAYPEAAWQWIDFLTRQPSEFGLLPVRRSVLTSPAYGSQVDNGAYTTYAYILEHLPESPWPGRYPWFSPAYDWLANEGLPAVMRGASDAESILSKAQSRALAAMTEIAEAGRATPAVIVQRPTVPPDTIDLTFLSWANVETYAELARLYEDEHLGVTIDMADFASGTDYPPRKLADAADVFPSPTGFSLSSVEEHWLNLQPLIENDPGVTLDDFYPQALQAYRRQGDLWGLPAELDAAMLFYNKSLFDAAGVDYPRPGWTWDNFLVAAARLTWGTGAEKQWGFVTLTDGWAKYPLALAAQQGGCLVDSRTSPTAPTLDDPAVVDAVRWYADLSQVHGVMPPPPVHYADWQTMESLVSGGQAAMWISSVGARYWVKMKLDLGVAPLPVPSDGGQLATMYNVIGYAISARTPHPQEAWRWLTFLTRQPEAMRALPARRSLADQATFPLVPRSLKPEVLQAYHLTLEDYADAGYDGVRAQIPWFDAVYRLYRQAVRQTLENGDDPTETLGSAQTIAKAYIACLEAHGGLDDESVAAACEEETGVPPLTTWYEE